MKYLFKLGIYLLLSACAPFTGSPFSDQLLRSERELNLAHISRISSAESDSVIRFAVFSDSHQNYKELDKVLYQINQAQGLDFAVSLGDMTNSSYNFEYDEFLDAIKILSVPAIYIIGNHDAIGAGLEIYKKAFGPTNFYFESDNFRFVFFNGNSLERPDDFRPEWLKATVDSSTKSVIIYNHEPLTDPERYTGNVAVVFNSVLNDAKVKAVLNGHNHVYNFSESSGTLLLQCGRVQGEIGPHWLTVEISAGQFCVKRMDIGTTECKTLKI